MQAYSGDCFPIVVSSILGFLPGSAPQPVVFGSPSCGAPLPSPSGCLHPPNPSHLPRTELWSLSLSDQPPPERLGLCHLGHWCRWSVWLSLCFALLSPVALLFSETLKFLGSADLPVNKVASQGVGSFFLLQLPLRSAIPVLIPSVSLSLLLLFSTQLCGGFLALFGGLSFSASIQ